MGNYDVINLGGRAKADFCHKNTKKQINQDAATSPHPCIGECSHFQKGVLAVPPPSVFRNKQNEIRLSVTIWDKEYAISNMEKEGKKKRNRENYSGSKKNVHRAGLQCVAACKEYRAYMPHSFRKATIKGARETNATPQEVSGPRVECSSSS